MPNPIELNERRRNLFFCETLDRVRAHGIIMSYLFKTIKLN